MTRPLLLLVNGNSRVDLTARMERLCRETLDDRMRLETLTVSGAPSFVSNRREATAAAAAIVESVLGRFADLARPRPDAVMLACFGEPGLLALRAELPVPVTGMLEASVHAAMQLGRRFRILTAGRGWPDQLEDLLRLYRLEGACAGIDALPDAALADDADTWRPAIQAAVDATGDRVVILGGGGIAGRAAALRPPPGVRLIDSFAAALAQTAALVQLIRR